jgi:hypothetical protein
MGRNVALVSALAVIALLAALTVVVVVRNGVDVLVIISLVILALLGFGVVGALTQQPPDE